MSLKDMTPADAQRRSAEARQIVEAPLFLEAKAFLDEQLAQLRRDVPIRDTDMHTRLILMEQLARKFYGFFELLAQTGKFREMELREIEHRQSLMEQGLSIFKRQGRGGL